MDREANEVFCVLFGRGICWEDGIILDLGVNPFGLRGVRQEGKEEEVIGE